MADIAQSEGLSQVPAAQVLKMPVEQLLVPYRGAAREEVRITAST
jgi:hypothetical protein